VELKMEIPVIISKGKKTISLIALACAMPPNTAALLTDSCSRLTALIA
jgi:hypothetical protein